MINNGQFICPNCNTKYEIGTGNWVQMEQFLLKCYQCQNCLLCFKCCNKDPKLN